MYTISGAPHPVMTDPLTTHHSIEALFTEHYRGLVRLVSGLLDDNETCEEIVQDAFAALLRGHRTAEAGREAAYLRSAVLNGARSQLRKRRVRRRHLRSLSPTAETTDAAETAAVAALEHQRVLEAIRDLPRRQSEVLLLRYQADLTEIEIAETLGISPGSVKTHASRGVAAVRDRLQEPA
ncbi:MAG: sigma-70 family RNA polymerase sigma factor [Acidimicrobiales bacterium]